MLDLRDITWRRSVGSVQSDGAYMKAEMFRGGVRHYVKLSNYDISRGIFGHESVNEEIAGRLGKLLGFKVPDGRLEHAAVRLDGFDFETYAYISKSFQNEGSRCALEDYYSQYRTSRAEPVFDFCLRNGWGYDIYMMFAFDYLILNRDRHGANIEVLKNGGKSLSPLFDNGLSFLCGCTDAGMAAAFDVMAERPVNNFVGERSLEKNLALIDARLGFSELKPAHRAVLFEGLGGVLPPVYFDKIWDMLESRWRVVKAFRAA